jgi:glycosyltransferase involved in cell wall biosynthesis
MEKPLVSVVTITRNRGNLLGRCIKSVLEQTYNNIEHIVVDGASDDNTDETVGSFKDERLHFIKLETNWPIKETIDHGISLCKGKYITFLDSDDEYLPEKYEEIFSILEKAIINVIKFCINKGDVYIITNSSIGWVEFSTNKFYPNLKKYIEKIDIISARSLYENTYPGNLKAWKEKAFLNLKNKINLKIPSNIICFGDSIVELEAGKKLASKINNSFIKTIKFKENPDPEDLIRQLNSIADMLDYIYSTVKNFSITIDKKDKYDFKNLCII